MPDCVVDAHLDPIAVEVQSGGRRREMFLQTSPESAMKQMLAAGAGSIYSIGPVFRDGETGRNHRVEFTMLEWYEVGGDQASAIEWLRHICANVLNHPQLDQITYRRLIQNHFSFDPIDATIRSLRQAARRVDESATDAVGNDRDGLLDILIDSISDGLGCDRPLVVTDYPLSQAALAKVSESDPACAARFELYVGGLELANGYEELTDPDELVRRYEINNQKRINRGVGPLPVQTQLITAMRSGLPPCSGVAMGVDRLQMAMNPGATIGDVMVYDLVFTTLAPPRSS